MYTQDVRKLDRESHQKLRNYVIKLLEHGKSRSEVIILTGASLSAIKIWWKIYKTKGLDGLVLKKRGIKYGTNRKLSSEQTKEIKNIMIEKTPDQLGLNFSLWTRPAYFMDRLVKIVFL